MTPKTYQIGLALGAVGIVAMLFLASLPTADEETIIHEGPILILPKDLPITYGEYPAPAGEGSILAVYICAKSATPGTTYATNNSATLEGLAQDYADADDERIYPDHSTAFDIVVRARFNKSEVFDYDNTQFNAAWCKMQISSANLNLAADTEMTAVVSQNSSSDDFIWINFYLQQDQAAADLTLSRDEVAEITEIQRQYYA